jgi:aminoglycoside N3'-acetyltransferase
MIKNIVKSLELPSNEIIFLHVGLKGITESLDYKEISNQLIEEIYNLYSPKTILIPTYTYSFTRTGIFDRVKTPSETGRFGEEVRNKYGFQFRTSNPIFSVIDTEKLFINQEIVNNNTAFGENSLFDLLSYSGYIMVNINLDVLRPAHLHYLEAKLKVPYRYLKTFPGTRFEDGELIEEIDYEYFVRDLGINPLWNRKKIEQWLERRNVLKKYSNDPRLMWLSSVEMDQVLVPKLKDEPNFLIY